MRKILRVLFSRYTMCALIILLDLSLLVFLSVKAYNYSLLFLVLSGLVTVSVFLSLINRDANP